MLLITGPAVAHNLMVGDGREYRLPSEALAAAQDGDTVSIAPGEYFDCSVVRTNGLMIQGEGEGAVITDKVCEEKAILVLRGNDTKICNLTLQRARVPDGNGAGIRLENQNLRVDHVHFKNNQVGILSGMNGGDVTVTDSLFTDGGSPSKYALMIGRSAHFTVRASKFSAVKGGQIVTAANYSEIIDNTISVGTGNTDEMSAYAILSTDGALLTERNLITVGPLVPRSNAVIGVWDDGTAILRGNRMVNQTIKSIALLKDWSWSNPMLQDNFIGAGDSLMSSSGVWRHRLSSQYYLRKTQAHKIASHIKQMIKHVLGS